MQCIITIADREFSTGLLSQFLAGVSWLLLCEKITKHQESFMFFVLVCSPYYSPLNYSTCFNHVTLIEKHLTGVKWTKNRDATAAVNTEWHILKLFMLVFYNPKSRISSITEHQLAKHKSFPAKKRSLTMWRCNLEQADINRMEVSLMENTASHGNVAVLEKRDVRKGVFDSGAKFNISLCSWRWDKVELGVLQRVFWNEALLFLLLDHFRPII